MGGGRGGLGLGRGGFGLGGGGLGLGGGGGGRGGLLGVWTICAPSLLDSRPTSRGAFGGGRGGRPGARGKPGGSTTPTGLGGRGGGDGGSGTSMSCATVKSTATASNATKWRWRGALIGSWLASRRANSSASWLYRLFSPWASMVIPTSPSRTRRFNPSLRRLSSFHSSCSELKTTDASLPISKRRLEPKDCPFTATELTVTSSVETFQVSAIVLLKSVTYSPTFAASTVPLSLVRDASHSAL